MLHLFRLQTDKKAKDEPIQTQELGASSAHAHDCSWANSKQKPGTSFGPRTWMQGPKDLGYPALHS